MLEQDLLEGLQNKSDAAFKEVFDNYYSHLCVYCNKIIRNESESEDIVMSKITKLWEHSGKFNSIEEVRGFLYLSVRNAAFNFLKRNDMMAYHHKILELNAEEHKESGIFKKLDIKDFHRSAMTVLDELSPQCRDIFNLVVFKNHTPAEAATVLNITDHQVHVQLSRAKKQLKDILKKRGYDFHISVLLILIGL